MKTARRLGRRKFLHLAAGAAALPALPGSARADDYPSHPVRIIVGYAAGGPTDIAGRLIGEILSKRFGQQFAVEDKPGAGSNLATEVVVNSPPDGYTLLLVTQSNAINATLYRNLNYDFVRDIEPIASLMQAPSVLELNPSVPITTVPELIAYAKANPGKLNMATAGIGSPPQLYGELFKLMTGINMTTVNYRGGEPGLVDLLAGQVQVMFEGITASIGYVRDGKLRALAVTSDTPTDALPDLPPIAHFVPGYNGVGWFGLGAPKGTPAPIIEKLRGAINEGIADPDVKARFAKLGAEPMPTSLADYKKLIADETEKWGKVVRAANLKAE
jgi:tripartite-type tricarboxylate transporter receptor subunit TctC